MTLEEIKEAILSNRIELHPEPLPTEGKGYSFWFGAPNTRQTNRILRISKSSASAPIWIKLAANDRVGVEQKRIAKSEFPFDGDLGSLLDMVNGEIDTYCKHLQNCAV
jgi:hypothetical protein